MLLPIPAGYGYCHGRCWVQHLRLGPLVVEPHHVVLKDSCLGMCGDPVKLPSPRQPFPIPSSSIIPSPAPQAPFTPLPASSPCAASPPVPSPLLPFPLVPSPLLLPPLELLHPCDDSPPCAASPVPCHAPFSSHTKVHISATSCPALLPLALYPPEVAACCMLPPPARGTAATSATSCPALLPLALFSS